MSFPNLFDTTISRLGYSLDGLSARQDAISNNVANVDTPGYLTKEVPFEQEMMNAMSDPQGATGVPGQLPGTITRNDLRMRNDGNNVDVDQQMTEMAATTVAYQADTQLISTKFAMLSAAIAPVS